MILLHLTLVVFATLAAPLTVATGVGQKAPLNTPFKSPDIIWCNKSCIKSPGCQRPDFNIVTSMCTLVGAPQTAGVEREAEAEIEAEKEAERETEAEIEREADSEVEAERENETEAEVEIENEAEDEVEAERETEREAEVEIEKGANAPIEAEREAAAPSEVQVTREIPQGQPAPLNKVFFSQDFIWCEKSCKSTPGCTNHEYKLSLFLCILRDGTTTAGAEVFDAPFSAPFPSRDARWCEFACNGACASAQFDDLTSLCTLVPRNPGTAGVATQLPTGGTKEAEAEAEIEAEKEAAIEAEAEKEAEVETEIEAEKEAEIETEAEKEAEVETEIEAEKEAEIKTEAEKEAEVETEIEAEKELEAEQDVEETLSASSGVPTKRARRRTPRRGGVQGHSAKKTYKYSYSPDVEHSHS